MNSKYDELYEIRLANENDIDSIMEFIDKYWKKDHILAKNKEFFKYEFLEEDGTVNFVLAIRKETGEIESTAGFLKASHSNDKLDLWDVMWKTRDGNLGLLGVELYKRKRDMIAFRHEMSVGDNPKTAVPLVKYILKRNVYKLNHYYMLSKNIGYEIASINNYKNIEPIHMENVEVIRFNTFEELKKAFDFTSNEDAIPYKDEWYIEHRFFNHPIYQYQVYGIKLNNKVDSFFVIREQEQGNKIALRFVDCVGKKENLAYIGVFLNKLLENPKYEYIDIYAYGLDDRILNDAGFIMLNENDENIIPDYFHPFEKRNVDIWADSSSQDTVFFKADGDQDRPN